MLGGRLVSKMLPDNVTEGGTGAGSGTAGSTPNSALCRLETYPPESEDCVWSCKQGLIRGGRYGFGRSEEEGASF